jgi:predicted nucleotidyltransferase
VSSPAGRRERIRSKLPQRADERRDELSRAGEALGAEAAPEAVDLFGSQARGDATRESDVDLLVVSEARKPSDQLARDAHRVVGEYGVPLDILVMSRAEFDQRPARASLPATVLREGTVPYAA